MDESRWWVMEWITIGEIRWSVSDPGKRCGFISMVIWECVGKASGSCTSSKKGDM